MNHKFNLVEGVYRLKYGYNKEYLHSLKEIIKAHKPKQEDGGSSQS